MDRQHEMEYYGIPQLDFGRSYYEYNTELQTSGNQGDIIPIYVNNLVQPGDTFSISEDIVINFNSSKTPSMGMLYKDTYWFAIPYIPLWTHTKEFFGENTNGAWVSETEYEIPKIKIGGNMMKIGSRDILNRLGVPCQVADETEALLGGTTDYVEQLSYRMYLHIYNNYFRNTNFIAPIQWPKGDETLEYEEDTFKDNENYVWADGTYPKSLLKAMRMHDYFTCIPEPQYGEQQTIAVGQSAPIKRNENATNNITISSRDNSNNQHPISFNEYGGTVPANSSLNEYAINGAAQLGIGSGHGNLAYYSGLYAKINENTQMYADLTAAVGPAINALRIDATIQQIKEQLAWFGSLYNNIVKSLWGVTISEDIVQIPEYLGGNRESIDMVTVLQQSASTDTSFQGNPTGYSNDRHTSHSFTKSFTYHGIIMGVCVIRQDHIYTQGIPTRMKKFRKYDLYWNAFKGLGAQPIMTNEIYWSGGNDTSIWGYRPAWREYCIEPSRANGLMQPGIKNSLAYWNYTDYYKSKPVQSAEWMNEKPDFVDRTLFVPSTISDQFRLDCVFKVKKVTEVERYNLPGIDRL